MIARQPPTAKASDPPIAPWNSNVPSSIMPSTALPGSFFNNDSSEQVNQLSPSFRPGTSRTAASDSPAEAFYSDERRPSVASATTISSQGSKSSTSGRGFHKKLQNYFGDDFQGQDSGPASETSLPGKLRRNGSKGTAGTVGASRQQRGRNNSCNTINTLERPESASSSRPRTPLPSSDVTPWIFQKFEVRCFLTLFAVSR